MTLAEIDHRRAIIDRRSISDRLEALPAGKMRTAEATAVLRNALEYGRAEIAKRLEEEPGAGRAAAQATAYLHDQLARLAWDFVCTSVHEQSCSEVAIVGLGGTG